MRPEGGLNGSQFKTFTEESTAYDPDLTPKPSLLEYVKCSYERAKHLAKTLGRSLEETRKKTNEREQNSAQYALTG